MRFLRFFLVGAALLSAAGCESVPQGGGKGDEGISLPPMLPWWKTETIEFTAVAPMPMPRGGLWE